MYEKYGFIIDTCKSYEMAGESKHSAVWTVMQFSRGGHSLIYVYYYIGHCM